MGKRGRFIFIILVSVMFLMPLVHSSQASLGTIKAGEPIELIQLCGTCTYNNITSFVFVPNSTTIISNVVMTRDGSEYNYSVDPQVNVGEYNVNGVGDINGINTAWSYKVFITKTGTTLTTSEAVLYIILVVSVFFFFLLSLWFTTIVPYSNKINDKNEIVQVTRLKYVKLMFVLITYVLFVWFLNTLIGLSENFITLTLFSGLVSFLFITLNNLALPFSIAILVLCGYEIIRDVNNAIDIKKFGSALKE